jgi:predicted nucleotidyltransferase
MTLAVLTSQQQAVVERFLTKEEATRRHLVVSLSGAHAYGFPSPDSDIDLKAVHIAPIEELLGLRSVSGGAERLEIIDNVELDYSSNELGPVLKGIIGGNGNFAERILGHLQPIQTPELKELKPLVASVLSQQLYRHYQGFSRQQLKEWEKSDFKSAKKLLYVLRTSLTGSHVLETGEIETDLNKLAARYGLEGLAELLQIKNMREKAELSVSLGSKWKLRVDELLTELDRSQERSKLPAQPSEEATRGLESWLISMRLKSLQRDESETWNGKRTLRED